MRRRSIWSHAGRVLALGGALLLVPSTSALAAESHKLNVRAKLAQVQGPPNIVSAGPATGFGKDAVLITRGNVTGTTLKGSFRGYNTLGSLVGTDKIVATVAADGSVTFAGTGKVTGGTGPYRGATGNVIITGSSPTLDAVATFKIKGTIKY